MVIKHVWGKSRDRGLAYPNPGYQWNSFVSYLIYCLTFDCSMAKSEFSPFRFLECRVYVLVIF